MSIVDTLRDISYESKLNKAEKHSLRAIAAEVQTIQIALASLVLPEGEHDDAITDEIMVKAIEELQAVLASHWLTGFREALKQYAWWKDGVQYVGSCSTTLQQALQAAEEELRR